MEISKTRGLRYVGSIRMQKGLVLWMNILSPSILAADFYELGEQLREMEAAGVRYLHIDVMDGMFVPSISFGMPVVSTLRKHTDLFFDVHLMIEEPERYIEEFARCGADLINFHVEASRDIGAAIRKIRSLGKKVGITIKPDTPAETVRPWLSRVDMVLVMTVEPGFGGQKLIPHCLDKVRAIRKMAEGQGLSDAQGRGLDIEVDGGIDRENVHLALEAGANVIVAGSAVFRGDVAENVKALQERLR